MVRRRSSPSWSLGDRKVSRLNAFPVEDLLNGGMDKLVQVVSSCMPSFSTEKVNVPC